MNVISATGNAVLDDHIKRFFDSSKKVSYLEELMDVKNDEEKVDVVILSSFLPSRQYETDEKQIEFLKEVVGYLLIQGIRIIFLADTTFSPESLRSLFNFGVYDFVISQDGNVNLEEIIKQTKTPTSKEEAQKKLELLVPNDKLDVKNKKDYKKEGVGLIDQRIVGEARGPEVTKLLNMLKPVREKTAAKVGPNTDEPKIFSFWSSSSNLGKRTLSQAFAAQIAKMGYSVLYCEFDYLNPSLALTTALTNNDKNFYQLALSQDAFDLNQFIANKMDVKITKEMVDLFEEIPPEFHFLGLPSGFEPKLFPTITNEDFLKTLLNAMKEIEYDAVVLNLPSQLENLFSFPVMLESDVIFNVVSASPVRISEYRSLMKMLADTSLNMNKWKVIVNQIGQGISKDTCDQMLGKKSILAIPYDVERSSYELDLRMGSPLINQKMIELAGLFGFAAPETNKRKKGFFGFLR